MDNPSLMERATRNFFFISLGTVSNFVIAFLFAGLTIRYLGEARAGYFMALTALFGLNAFLGDFGLSTPVVRRVAILSSQGDLSTIRVLVGSVMTASLFSALIIALPAMFFFEQVFNWSKLDTTFMVDAYWATLFTLGTGVLNQLSNPWRATFNALERYDIISTVDIIFGFLSGILGIAALILYPTMTTIAAVRFFVMLVRSSVSAALIHRLLEVIPWPTWVWKEIRPMLGFSGWVYFSKLGRTMLNRIDRIILTTFLGSAQLPFYEFPQQIFSRVHGALAQQSQFLFPMFSSFGGELSDHVSRLEDILRWLIALSSSAVYTALALLGFDLLQLVVGSDFASRALIPLYLMCIQGFFQAQDIVPYNLSHAAGEGKPNSIKELTQGSLVVLTAFFLVPKMGIIGASIAQLWVIITFVLHSIWVRKMLLPSSNSLGWIKSLISPISMALIWLLVTNILLEIWKLQGYYYLAVVAGFMVALASMAGIEIFLFRDEDRLKSLHKIVTYLIRSAFHKVRASRM